MSSRYDTARVEASRRVLRAVVSAARLVADDAEPIRFAENDLWRIPGGIVVRIARPGQDLAAAREVAVARWLAEHDVPAAVPLPIEQPVVAEGRAATFWHELPEHHQGTSSDLADLLRQLHDLPAPTDRQPELRLRPLDPFVRIRERVAATEIADQDGRDFLLDELEKLRVKWRELPADRPVRLIHGDAWRGNCVVTGDGRRYLLDFERTSLGFVEWDLTSTAVAVDTLGTISSEEYNGFCRAYGSDVRLWDGYLTMRSVRELRLVTFALQIASQDPAAGHEAQYRLACVRGSRGPRPWGWSPVG